LCLCRCDHLHRHQLEALALEALDDATHLRALRAYDGRVVELLL
jgi:hypothetical protein